MTEWVKLLEGADKLEIAGERISAYRPAIRVIVIWFGLRFLLAVQPL